MFAANRLLILTMVFCGVVFVASCSDDDNNPSDKELFEQEMTAALADAREYGPHTDALAKEVAARFDGCVTENNIYGAWLLWSLQTPDQRLRLLGRHR